jgi:hypothetical protein
MTTTAQPAAGVPAYYVAPAAPPITVTTPVGSESPVMNQDEADYYNGQCNAYMSQFLFTNVADLADLTRVLFYELLMHRLSQWAATGVDYDGITVDAGQIRRAIKEYGDSLSKVKNDLGMTKSQRDKEKEQDTGAYLVRLKQRAREFGIHRENQLRKAMQLMNDLSYIVGSFDRSDQVERDKLGFSTEHDILEWIRETMLPEFIAVDDHFRKNQQRFWQQEL